MRPLCTGKRNHNHVRAGEKNRFFRNEGKPPARPSHLVAHVDVGVLGQQERHQVHAALLRRQVDGADALPRHRVGVGTVLQQRGPDVHLVLLGGDVEGRVAVLKESGSGAEGTCFKQPPLLHCFTAALSSHAAQNRVRGGKKSLYLFHSRRRRAQIRALQSGFVAEQSKKKIINCSKGGMTKSVGRVRKRNK